MLINLHEHVWRARLEQRRCSPFFQPKPWSQTVARRGHSWMREPTVEGVALDWWRSNWAKRPLPIVRLNSYNRIVIFSVLVVRLMDKSVLYLRGRQFLAQQLEQCVGERWQWPKRSARWCTSWYMTDRLWPCLASRVCPRGTRGGRWEPCRRPREPSRLQLGISPSRDRRLGGFRAQRSALDRSITILSKLILEVLFKYFIRDW